MRDEKRAEGKEQSVWKKMTEKWPNETQKDKNGQHRKMIDRKRLVSKSTIWRIIAVTHVPDTLFS
jgi:hypothetical protein